MSEGFVGSDIEYIVEEAKLSAYHKKEPLTLSEIETVMSSIPRSTENVDIKRIREMCTGRYRSAGRGWFRDSIFKTEDQNHRRL